MATNEDVYELVDEDFLVSNDLFFEDDFGAEVTDLLIEEDDFGEDYDLVEKCDVVLEKLPTIVFVSEEEDIKKVFVDDSNVVKLKKKKNSTSTTTRPIQFTCEKCSKGYKVEGYFRKHQAICHKEPQKAKGNHMFPLCALCS